jgi:hypothetical protein
VADGAVAGIGRGAGIGRRLSVRLTRRRQAGLRTSGGRMDGGLDGLNAKDSCGGGGQEWCYSNSLQNPKPLSS